ncbi:DUF6198 family protein [Irregularibacter muris]|uniref:DUF6198 family protein n=1 Tax=Irregularibacter muris TaxID=1796619 RepID=A0AAE3L1Y4_9FIRM|nr:DUF6198 family protein [Irregularibacter muris]MCR1897689.1 DUF6198 family protein [Irregularibacter muris]
MEKLKIYNLFLFLLGLACLSLGVVLVVKSDLGISVATSVPYVFSLYFTKLSFGQWNYIIHGFSLLLLVIMIKKLTVKHLMSFIVAFLFGVTIDLFGGLLTFYTASTLVERIMLFILSSVVISVGLASLIKSNYPILPFDTFVKEITEIKNIKYKKFKTGFDLVCFTISFASSMLFFRKLQGLHIGTLVSAIILGSMIGSCLNFMNKYVGGKPLLPEEKTKAILDFDFIKFSKSKVTS